jgi:hypothetical protein
MPNKPSKKPVKSPHADPGNKYPVSSTPVQRRVADIKGVGAKPSTGPGADKVTRVASKRIIRANKGNR